MPKEKLICGSGNLRVYVQETPGKPVNILFRVVDVGALGQQVEVDVPLDMSGAMFVSRCLNLILDEYVKRAVIKDA